MYNKNRAVLFVIVNLHHNATNPNIKFIAKGSPSRIP